MGGMKGRFSVLLGALSLLLSDRIGGAATPTRTRAHKPWSKAQKGQLRAADRKRRFDHLSRIVARWGTWHLSPEELADWRTLRLTRGRLARRMLRDRSKSINVRLRDAAMRRVARAAKRRQERAA